MLCLLGGVIGVALGTGVAELLNDHVQLDHQGLARNRSDSPSGSRRLSGWCSASGRPAAPPGWIRFRRCDTSSAVG